MHAETFFRREFPGRTLVRDRDLALAAKQQGCPRCHGVLDVANYPRKPRGSPIPLGDEHQPPVELVLPP